MTTKTYPIIERAQRGDGKWLTNRVWVNTAPTVVRIYDLRLGAWVSEMISEYGNVRFTPPVVASMDLATLLDAALESAE